MVQVCRGRHGDLDDDVLALEGIMIGVDSAVGGAAGLELEIFGASSLLLFEECGDDA